MNGRPKLSSEEGVVNDRIWVLQEEVSRQLATNHALRS